MSHRLAVITLFFAVATNACGPVYLAPAANAPLLEKRGELHAGVYGGTNGTDVQLAYAPLEHLGIVAAGSYWKKQGEPNRHSFGELGAGSYLSLGGWGVLEGFAGAGMGKSYGRGILQLGKASADFTGRGTYLLGYAQGDIALTTRVVDFGLSTRLSYVNYHFDEIDLRAVDMAQRQLFFEPILFLRVGWQITKAEMQVGLVVPTLGGAPNLIGNPLLLHLCFGLHFELGPELLGGGP